MTDNYRNDDGMIEEGDASVHPLAQDFDAPFSPPTDPIDDPTLPVDERARNTTIDPTSPATDSNIDQHQVYDEGLASATETHVSAATDTVLGYTPEQDQQTTKGDS